MPELMTLSIRTIAGACALVMTMAGCHDNTVPMAASAAPVTPPITPHSPTPPTSSEMNRASAASGVGSEQRSSAANSWTEYLSSVGQDDRRFLEAVASRYYGTLQFDNAHERNALSKLGIPTPGEWLSSREYSDEELAVRGEGGDADALIFLTDRLIARMSGVRSKARESSYLAYVNSLPEEMRSPGRNDLVDAVARASSSYSLSPTPFTAYQYGIAMAEVTGSPSIIPASITIAGELGDARAAGILASYYKTAPRSDDAAVLQAEDIMREMSLSPLKRK